MSEPVIYRYRIVEVEGEQVTLPAELMPSQDMPPRKLHASATRAFRAERRRMWIAWQRLGLPLPDPDTGRCDLHTGVTGLAKSSFMVEAVA